MAKFKLPCLLVGLALVAGLQTASAAILLLDFGPTTVADGSLTNSPYQSVSGAITDPNWNKVGTADTSALKWSNGDDATGLSLNPGQTTTFGSTTVNFGSSPAQHALGNSVNTGIYADTSVGKDGIYADFNSGSTRMVAIQVGGLTAGTYDIYTTARNTNTGNVLTQNLYVGTTGTAGEFDFAGMTPQTINYPNGAFATTAWVEGQNYFKTTVTIAQGQYLNLGTIGTGERGFLNSVEIVLVPEPSSGLLLLGASTVVLLRRRKRRAA